MPTNTNLSLKDKVEVLGELEAREARASNPTLPISSSWLQEKAKSLAAEQGDSDFKASNKWLEGFKQRHRLSSKRTCGEAAKVNQEDVNQWLENNEGILNDYSCEDIFNADETGFFYKMMPNRTVHFKGEACHGGEQAKDRFTVLLCANFAGTEKLLPLVIGHSRNPRCFPKLAKREAFHDSAKLGCHYRSQKRAWMDTAIFTEWLLKIEGDFRKQKRRVLLLLDNFKGHEVDIELNHVKILFLPPRTTSKSQPMDQGIICNVKQLYKKKLVEHYWAMAQDGQVKEINLLQGIRFLRESWDDVKTSTIFNCFKKCLPNVRNASAQSENSDDIDEPDRMIIRDCFPISMTFGDFVQADRQLVTSDDFEPEHNEVLSETSDEEPGSPFEEPSCGFVTGQEALRALATLVNHCSQRQNIVPGISMALHQYRDLVICDILQEKRQADLRYYFSKSKP
ncbi:tigger transposable element-derived protein 6-like [Galendromus occidentalis]|uniref:Tigger transposable element-derived protein 6-like n=1 Tax=Galendromus occidentalis TaxID=34638 RepID=A0AAJ6VYQ7_9ACAR|nr:tigger transposable element-derived protein 6-like [Galendromus occidentalis]